MITCILTSHMKPYLRDALNSVLAQTRLDLQVLVLDSGAWQGKDDERSQAMAAIRADFEGHPLVEWWDTGEGPDLRAHKCPVAYVTNTAIRDGLVRGEYVCTFYDDDIYYPTFMEKMAGYLDEHPEAGAVWCSQRVLWNDAEAGARMATSVKLPGQFDNQVDGAQIMFRRSVLDAIGDPWLPEEPTDSTCRHSDGIFLEKLANVCGEVPYVSDVLLAHRHTPLSTYSPTR